MNAVDRIADLVGQVPAGAWLALAAGTTVLSVVTWSAASRRLRRAAAGHDSMKDVVLTVAALVPAVLFWAMVLAGSFHGLVDFGRHTLGWRGGWEYLVPGTLDGVSVTFALLAFRAVRLQKSPTRCQRVVWGAALASAIVNFAYEYSRSNHNAVAGGYLGLLSMFGMVMFDEFLNQFEQGTGYVRRENPAFGLRWLTWPTNTFCAAVAWRNHPPAEGTLATVLNAVANLGRVRTLKAAARDARVQARHVRAVAGARWKAELSTAVDRSPVLATMRAKIQEEPPAGARIPAAATTVAQWIDMWVRMCHDGDMAFGPINDESARVRFGVTARQLRNIRRAATSGILRHRAGELSIPLPAEYIDSPAHQHANGHPPHYSRT